jgi:hypothetical protein
VYGTIKTLNSQSNYKEVKSERHYTSWFKIIFYGMVIKTLSYQHKRKHIEHNREHKNKFKHIWTTHFLTKASKRDNSVFSINCPRKTGFPHAKKRNWTFSSYHTLKINSKWIIYLNIRPGTIKLRKKRYERAP